MIDKSLDQFTILFGGPGREEIVFKMTSEGYKINTVCLPKKAKGDLELSKKYFLSKGLNVIECEKNKLDRIADNLEGTILLSIGFPFLLSKSFLEKFKLCLNVHPTLLPNYRGPTTGAYILINDEKESGSTVHFIDEGMDTGAIVHQIRFSLSKFDTIRSVQRKTYEQEPKLVIEAFKKLEDPKFIPIVQDPEKGKNYPKRRSPEDSEIDPKKSLIENFDMIRSSDIDNYPAFFYVEGQKVCIKLWRPDKSKSEEDLI